MDFIVKKYVDRVPVQAKFLLGIDIGGTNSSCGVFIQREETLFLILSVHSKSQEITSFGQYMKELTLYLFVTYQISPKIACVAAAGIVSSARDQIIVTNLPFIITAHEIYQNTQLEKVYLANDFEIIFYGIMLFGEEKLLVINKGISQKKETCAIIGAGTGFGKSIITWNETRTVPLAILSEGGHADFVAHSLQEHQLAEYIMKHEKRSTYPSWEDVLSGKGIKLIYGFFRDQMQSDPDISPHPDAIFANKDRDASSGKTYTLYTKLYGRCAKNFALETLCRGGLFIVGGIAVHNQEMFFSPLFLEEFFYSFHHQKFLKEVRLTVVTDYNVSLYGAAAYIQYKEHARE